MVRARSLLTPLLSHGEPGPFCPSCPSSPLPRHLPICRLRCLCLHSHLTSRELHASLRGGPRATLPSADVLTCAFQVLIPTLRTSSLRELHAAPSPSHVRQEIQLRLPHSLLFNLGRTS